MPTPITEIGVSLKLIEKAPVDAKNIVETLAEAQALAYEGYNPYIKELKGFHYFVVANGDLTPRAGVTFETVQALIANIVDSSPATLDTLKELAEAVNNDPNFGAGMISNITTINTQITKILGVIAVAPTYYTPTATLTGSNQTIEKGTNLNLTLNIGFNKNDAGDSTGYTLLRNGVILSNLQNNTQLENDIQSVITFQAQVSHLEGIANKLNNLDIEDPTGHILAGSVNSPIQTITPKSKIFYGNMAALPTTSAQIRALASVFDGATQIDLPTGITNNVFVVAVPQNRSITNVTDISNLNLTITDQYALIDGAFIVNDAGGNPQTCKLYAMQPAIPYSSNAIHRIIIG